jgi:mRNA-degrading endonuclease toxin of MazEF toxin-antitoxin module
LNPGDVVIAAFPGAEVTKTRPVFVISTADDHRPDVILALITTKPRFRRAPPIMRSEIGSLPACTRHRGFASML